MLGLGKFEIGNKYGKLIVIQPSTKNRYYICKCDCGIIKEIRSDHLYSGRTQSCGCLRSKFGLYAEDYELIKYLRN